MVKTLVLSRYRKIAFIADSDNIITDLVIEKGSYQIGDIYIGLVTTLLPSINAAFVLLDSSQMNGFIHINNLGHLKKRNRSMNIINHLYSNSTVMVQIIKAPNGRKGPTLSGKITLQGRYLTLLPFEDGIVFSKHLIGTDEAIYLKILFSLIKPNSIGILVNKVVLMSNLEKIIQDFYSLIHQWDCICKNIILTFPPALISKKENFISKIVHKLYTEKTNKIVIDSIDESKKIASLITKWKNKDSFSVSIKFFQNYGFLIRNYNLDLLIYDLLQSRINLYGGGYIIIENTEALTTVDVNSGSFTYFNNPRETALLVNKRAAKQIARHIKLRNISGVIVVDFIDMNYYQDQLELIVYFDSLLKQDEAKPTIMQFSELGLVELTRKRQNKSLAEVFSTRYNYLSNFNYFVYISSELSNFSFGHTLFSESYNIYSL